MERQGLTKRHHSLRNYLTDIVGLDPIKWRFGNTEGSSKASISETQQYSAKVESVQVNENNELNIDLVPTGLNPVDIEPDIQMHHEYVIHLVLQDFDGDISRLQGQLHYWLASERQDPALEYTLKWNNDSNVDLHIYLDIEERSSNQNQQLKTC